MKVKNPSTEELFGKTKQKSVELCIVDCLRDSEKVVVTTTRQLNFKKVIQFSEGGGSTTDFQH